MKTDKMTKDEAKLFLLDYIYGEINEDQKIDVERCLKAYPDLQAELDELRDTLRILQSVSESLPAETVPEHLVQVNLKQRNQAGISVGSATGSFSGSDDGPSQDPMGETSPAGDGESKAGGQVVPKWQSVWARAGLAAAVVLITILVAGAISDMEIRSDSEGWSLTFGSEPPVIQEGFDEAALNEMIELIRQENLLMASSLIEESQLQQEAQMQQIMVSILEYMELRREEDVTQLANGIARVDEDSYQRFRLTSEALDGLYSTILLSQQ